MPLGPGVRYRVKTTSTGKQVRLAFKGGNVIEAKNLKTGATHTPDEFAADRARRRRTASTLAGHLTQLRGSGAFQKRASQ
jgi:hypothetical protein